MSYTNTQPKDENAKQDLDLKSKAHQKLHSTALKQFNAAEEWEKENRITADEDFRFLGGEQWPDVIKRQRRAQFRPCLTINRLPQFTAQVIGDARQNKPTIKLHPVDSQADPEKAEILEGIIRHIENISDADVAYMTALEHATGGGFGHWRVITDYCDDESFNQEIYIRRITNPFAVYWDHNSTMVDRSDAKWCFVTEWMTHDAFDAKYPEADGRARDWTTSNVRKLFGDWHDSKKGVRVAEYWCVKMESKTVSLMDTGEIVEGKQEGAKATRELYTRRVVRYVLSGNGILEGEQTWAGRYIPIISVYGPEEFVDGRIRYRSLIRYAKDPQRMFNYWQTAITEKIALAPKVPFVGTRKQFEGVERFWDNINVSNKQWIPYNHDPKAPGPPMRTDPAQLQPAELQQSAQSVDDLKATIGLYDASLGNRGNEASGRAILARQREGDVATFAWIDNLARGIEHTGRIIVDLIPHIYDTKRVMRIIGEDGSQKTVTINEPQYGAEGSMIDTTLNDVTVGKYDVVVTAGPSYATRRLEAAESMLKFIQAYPAAAGVSGDLIAKNMDWPGADDIAKRLKTLLPMPIQKAEASEEELKELEKMSGPTPEQQVEMMNAEMEKMKLQLEGMKAMPQVQKTEEEVESARLDNIQKALEIQMQTEGFIELLNQVVKGNLVQINQQPNAQQQPQLPGAPQPGPGNAGI